MALDQEGMKDGAAKSAEVTKRVVRALVFPAEAPVTKYAGAGATPASTKTPQEDPFASLGASGNLIEPPFDLLTLSMLLENNTDMQPCIEAMEVNCDGLGHRLVPRVRLDKKTPPEVLAAVEKERVLLENFFGYASIDDSFTELRRKRRRDLESCGNAYWEVIRGVKNDVQGFEHVPAHLWRLCRQEPSPFPAKMPIAEMQDDGSVKIVERTFYKRFRTYALQRASQRTGNAMTLSTEVVYFKEFGDPRTYDKSTGEVVADGSIPEQQRANEVIHFRLYAGRTPYGIPRYIGNLLNIFGARAAEEINFVTFKSNNIPSMMLMVSNGQLTDATIKRISEFVESHVQGSANYSKILIVEAESPGTDDLAEDAGNVKIDVKPLTADQHTDAMFVNYLANSGEKVRGSWRLPPLLLGKSEDHTKGNAEQSRKLADEQVFAPERDNFDATMNRRVLPAMGVAYHRFRSNTPVTTDNTELIKIATDTEKTGGMTPEIARDVLEEVLGRDLPEFPPDFPKDIPFSLLMAQAVKNMADPTQPGQQVTALKEGNPPPPDQRVTDPVKHVNDLLGARAMLEQGWRNLIGDRSEETPKIEHSGEPHH